MIIKILIVIGIIVLIYILLTINSLIRLNNKVKESFATMDVYLKKRWDLIPNLVEVVKSYSNYEKNTLQNIINLRNNNYDELNYDDKLKTNNKLSENITKLFALVENYPEIKANENFLKLSDNLTKIEDEIANSRKYYNAIIRIYNNKVEMFPSNIIAKLFKFKVKTMYEIKESEKESVKVEV